MSLPRQAPPFGEAQRRTSVLLGAKRGAGRAERAGHDEQVAGSRTRP